jgi:hypothetical protein
MERALKPEELALLRSMLESAAREDLIEKLDDANVVEMKDGGMGSLRFITNATKMDSVLCEAEGVDADGVPLEISINVDEHGSLFELDIWKVDFTPLQSYPQPLSLRFLNPKS